MRTALVCLFTIALIGCSPSSPYMRPTPSPIPLRPAAGRAVVVFVRPSGYAWGVGANILDEQGRFVGDALAKSYFAVQVAPGHHEFVVWAENTDIVAADVVANHVYFVEVAPTMGAFSAQVHLKAIKPGLPSWERREEWLRDSKQLLQDFAGGQANLDRRPSDVAERLRRGREHLSKYSGEELGNHRLAPEDGLGG